MKKYIIILSFILVTLLLLILFYYYNITTKDHFIAPIGFRHVPLFASADERRIINTPLTPLKSKLFIHKDLENTTPFLCYNLELLNAASDQGSICGSCWAFVVANTIADRIITMYNGTLSIQLSPQQLLQCYDYPKGCGGEAPEDVYKWIIDNNFKMMPNGELPYLQSISETITQKCPSPPKSGITLKKDSLFSITEYIEGNIKSTKNIQNMKKELALNGPFFATIAIYEDFINWVENEPYVNQSSVLIGGHAIEIVGYCSPNVDGRPGYNKGYWICKNTWGPNWPKLAIYPGYFSVRMGENMCGIESRCGSVIPEVEGVSEKSDKFMITSFPLFATSFIMGQEGTN